MLKNSRCAYVEVPKSIELLSYNSAMNLLWFTLTFNSAARQIFLPLDRPAVSPFPVFKLS